MDRKKSPLRWIIPLLLLGLLIAAGVFVWNGSVLGQALPTPFIEPAPLGEAPLPAVGDPNTSTTSAGTPGSAQEPASPDRPQPVCGGPPELTVLAVGIDENAQTDVIRLVRLDYVEKRIVILSIPRDFWVDIPGMEGFGIKQGRINAAYGYGEHYTGRGSGIGLLANTIAYNFGVQAEHYGIVYFSSFARLVDQIGGIEINLEIPVDGTLTGLPYFPAGLNQLNGQAALDFSRIRYIDTDDYRIDRQTLVVREALKKMRNTLTIPELLTFTSQAILEGSVTTDLSMSRAYTMACLGQMVDGDDIHFLNIPPELFTPTTTSQGANVRIPSEEVGPYIQAALNGQTLP